MRKLCYSNKTQKYHILDDTEWPILAEQCKGLEVVAREGEICFTRLEQTAWKIATQHIRFGKYGKLKQPTVAENADEEVATDKEVTEETGENRRHTQKLCMNKSTGQFKVVDDFSWEVLAEEDPDVVVIANRDEIDITRAFQDALEILAKDIRAGKWSSTCY